MSYHLHLAVLLPSSNQATDVLECSNLSEVRNEIKLVKNYHTDALYLPHMSYGLFRDPYGDAIRFYALSDIYPIIQKHNPRAPFTHYLGIVLASYPKQKVACLWS